MLLQIMHFSSFLLNLINTVIDYVAISIFLYTETLFQPYQPFLVYMFTGNVRGQVTFVKLLVIFGINSVIEKSMYRNLVLEV